MDDFYINKICNGDDEDAFRYFLQTYKDMAFTIAMSVVKNEFTAQEVVQDAFVKAFTSLKSFNRKSTFKTWFYRIVVNEALMRARKSKNDFIIFKEDYDDDIIDEGHLLTMQADEQTYLVNEALKMLPPNESLALRLFYLEEESIKEVCEITGWSAAATKVTLHRARKHMLGAINMLIKTQA